MKTLSPLLLTLACLAAGPAHAVFKCVDEKGVTHYGDTMPPQCAKTAVTEISGGGNYSRKIEAPLTPEQIKAKAENEERNKETNKLMAEQKLRDTALLSTYGAEREFDVARDKEVGVLDTRKKTLMSRNEEVDKRLAKLKNEMEFYEAGKSKGAKAKEPPAQLVKDYAQAKADRVGLDNEIANVDRNRAEIIARRDEEKARWKKLKAGMMPGTLVDANGKITNQPELQSTYVTPLAGSGPRGVFTCDGKKIACQLGKTYFCIAPDPAGSGRKVSVNLKCEEEVVRKLN